MKKHSSVNQVVAAVQASKAKPSVKGKAAPELYVGLDLGDRQSRYCVLNRRGELVKRGAVMTDKAGMRSWVQQFKRAWIALEVGTHSPWVSELIQECGQRAVVANAREVASIAKSDRKGDRHDAETLARLLRLDEKLLHEIHHRSPQARRHRALLQARDSMVRARSRMIASVRMMMKSDGDRLPQCSADAFAARCTDAIASSPLRAALLPMCQQIGELTSQIAAYKRVIEALARTYYPEVERLQQVSGVGPITSLAYVLTLERAERFRHSRDVGAYVGLVRKRRDSGASSPQLRISKAGDGLLRRLLVNNAHYILGPFGRDCDLRRFGLRIASIGGKNAKKRAAVAVARKLSVLLHRLWKTGEVYQPMFSAARVAAA